MHEAIDLTITEKGPAECTKGFVNRLITPSPPPTPPPPAPSVSPLAQFLPAHSISA